jgi:signal peptide peptidase SppA
MKNLSHLAARVFNTPLMIDQQKLTVVLSALAPRLGVEPPMVDAALLAEQRSRRSYAVTESGVAVIEVSGSLVNRASGMDAQSGLTSYEQLSNEVIEAATDPAARGILLRVDSYGGEADGAFDLAALIEEAGKIKPVWASADSLALSAGYLIASAASQVWLTQTAQVGSVGVIAMHLDQSQADQAQGIKYTTVFAGDRKNDFNPHEPLSDDAHDVLRTDVDLLYARFVEAVARQRGVSAQAVRRSQAGIFRGADAVAIGFADRVGTFHQALAAMSAPFQSTTGGKPMSEPMQVATAPPAIPNPDLAALEADAHKRGYDEAAEIVELCHLAGRVTLASEFIARGISAAEARKELLALRAGEDSQVDIRSHVLPEASTGVTQNLDDNPVVKACASLGAKGGV